MNAVGGMLRSLEGRFKLKRPAPMTTRTTILILIDQMSDLFSFLNQCIQEPGWMIASISKEDGLYRLSKDEGHDL